MARDSRLLAEARRFSEALEARNQAAVDRMAQGWLAAQERVSLEVQTLLSKMDAARRAGVEISPAWLYQERRLANLTDLIRTETARWAPYASQEVWDVVADAMLAATRDARSLAREAAAVDLPGVAATFASINPAVAAQQVAHLAAGPLQALLQSYGTEAAAAASDALTQGVLLGKGSDWITRELATALDIPRWRAETMARTEALRTYREVSRQTYAASNVVQSWMWQANLDRACCPACVMMHGTIHPVTETLDGHPRCRCTMLPQTLSWAQIDPTLAHLDDGSRVEYETGVVWFARQSDGYQRSLLGPLKWDAWKSGEIALPDVVARTYSPDWGTMRRERSMVEIRAGRNANYGAVPVLA